MGSVVSFLKGISLYEAKLVEKQIEIEKTLLSVIFERPFSEN